MYKINNHSEHFRGGGGGGTELWEGKSQGSHLLNETLLARLNLARYLGRIRC